MAHQCNMKHCHVSSICS